MGLNDDMPNGSVVEPLLVCCVPNGLNAARKIHIYNLIIPTLLISSILIGCLEDFILRKKQCVRILSFHLKNGATLRDNVTFLLRNVDVTKSKRHKNNG